MEDWENFLSDPSCSPFLNISAHGYSYFRASNQCEQLSFDIRSRFRCFQTANDKKFELLRKSYVSRAIRFLSQGSAVYEALREAKRAMGRRMEQFSIKD